MDQGKHSYECRVYESVDDTDYLSFISNFDRKRFREVMGYLTHFWKNVYGTQ